MDNAIDFNRDKIALTDNLNIDNKVTFGTRLNIEAKLKKSWANIDWDSAANTLEFIKGIALQLPENKERDIKEIDAEILKVEISLLNLIIDRLFEVNLKKSMKRMGISLKTDKAK